MFSISGIVLLLSVLFFSIVNVLIYLDDVYHSRLLELKLPFHIIYYPPLFALIIRETAFVVLLEVAGIF